MELNTGMNTSTEAGSSASRRIHPLLAAAAAAVILACVTAVAAMTGFLPKSQGSGSEYSTVPAAALTAPSQPAPREPLALPAPAAKPAAPAVKRAHSHSAPAHNALARDRAPVREPSTPVASSPEQAAPAERPVQVAAAPVPPPAAAPVPRNLGTVESVREISQAGEGSGLGAVAGGLLGAVLGHQIGGGNGQKVMAAAGAAGGAYAGHQIEKRTRGTKRWEITVRMEDDGTLRTISTDATPSWRSGDRVRIVSGTLQPV